MLSGKRVIAKARLHGRGLSAWATKMNAPCLYPAFQIDRRELVHISHVLMVEVARRRRLDVAITIDELLLFQLLYSKLMR